MGGCCARHRQDELFKDRFARRTARRYRRKGLGKTSQLLVECASAGGLDGATVADLGGGGGQVMLELLPAYEEHARALAVGVMSRVVCCTPDGVALTGIAASLGPRLAGRGLCQGVARRRRSSSHRLSSAAAARRPRA